MTIAQGYKTKVGWGAQSVFGTGVAPTNFARVNVGGFKGSNEQKPILVPTQESVRQANYVSGKIAVAPTMAMPFTFQGLELLLKHATGGTPVDTQIGSTAVYTHSFVLADSLPAAGLSVHWEADAGVMGTAYRYESAKINKLTLSQDMEKALSMSVDFIGQKETKQSSVSASYAAQNMVAWNQVTTMNINGSAVKSKMSEFVIDNALDGDIYVLGSQFRDDVLRKDSRIITGKQQVLVDSGTLYDLYRNQTEVAIAMEWTGPIADGSTPFKMRVNVPRLIFTGTPPDVSGQGPVWIELPWQGLYNGSADEITIELDNLLTAVP